MSLILVSLCGLISCVSHHKHLLVHLSCHSITKTKQGLSLPGGRHPAAPLSGGRGFSVKFFIENLRLGPWRTGTRQRGGRPLGRPGAKRPPPLHYIRVWLPPHPSFASLKIQKKRKEMRDGERRSGETLPDFQTGDCR